MSAEHPGTTAARVRALLTFELGLTKIQARDMTDDSAIVDDLRADDLELIEIHIVCEDEFGLRISDEDFEGLTTVGHLIAYLTAHTGGA